MTAEQMRPGLGMRVFRWADAPAELRAALEAEAGGSEEWGYIAWVSAENSSKAEGAFGWSDVHQVEMEDGSLLIAGNRPRRT